METKMKLYRMPLDGDVKVPMPQYSSEGAACFDLYSANTETIELPPKRITKVPLGIKVQVEEGWELKLYNRSGMSSEGVLSIVQGTGHIDSDYRGEVKALVYNTTSEWYSIDPFSRICQGKLEEAPQWGIEEVSSEDELTTTVRGDGGFGSTGVSETSSNNAEPFEYSEEFLQTKTVLELKKIADELEIDRTGLTKKVQLIEAIIGGLHE